MDGPIRKEVKSSLMNARTFADETLRGTTPLSLVAFASGCVTPSYAPEERMQPGHQGNLDHIQKPSFLW